MTSCCLPLRNLNNNSHVQREKLNAFFEGKSVFEVFSDEETEQETANEGYKN